jgi:hypothetical protein
MARITWANIGPGIEVVTDPLNITATISSTAPALIIPMDALASGGLDVAASMSEVEKVMLAIHKRLKAWTKADANLNDSLIEVDAPTVGNTNRTSTTGVKGDFRTLDYAVSFYKPDAITSEFDPDKLDIPTP